MPGKSNPVCACATSARAFGKRTPVLFRRWPARSLPRDDPVGRARPNATTNRHDQRPERDEIGTGLSGSPSRMRRQPAASRLAGASTGTLKLVSEPVPRCQIDARLPRTSTAGPNRRASSSRVLLIAYLPPSKAVMAPGQATLAPIVKAGRPRASLGRTDARLNRPLRFSMAQPGWEPVLGHKHACTRGVHRGDMARAARRRTCRIDVGQTLDSGCDASSHRGQHGGKREVILNGERPPAAAECRDPPPQDPPSDTIFKPGSTEFTQQIPL